MVHTIKLHFGNIRLVGIPINENEIYIVLNCDQQGNDFVSCHSGNSCGENNDSELHFRWKCS